MSRSKICPGGCGRAIPKPDRRCVFCAPGKAAKDRALEAVRHAKQGYRKGYQTAAYRKARSEALTRAGGVCTAIVGAVGSTGRRCPDRATEVHHIVPLSQGGSAHDPTNLAPVCFKHNPRGGPNARR